MRFDALALPILGLIAGTTTAQPAKRDTTIETRADYTPGWCGVHVAQTVAANQDDFLITAEIFDGVQKSMGKIAGEYVANDASVYIQSPIPDALEIIPRPEMLYFKYGGDEWAADDKARCSLGGWDGPEGMKIRHMDCGFAC